MWCKEFTGGKKVETNRTIVLCSGASQTKLPSSREVSSNYKRSRRLGVCVSTDICTRVRCNVAPGGGENEGEIMSAHIDLHSV